MVILKKVRASTLMETLVATVLIVVAFMIASMILNNLFSNTIKSNTQEINTYLNELQYFFFNNELQLPYYDDYKTWEVSINKSQYTENKNMVLFKAINKETKQHITRHVFER